MYGGLIRNSPTLFQMLHIGYSLLFPKIGGSHPHSKLQSGFQTKLLGNLHSYASTVGSNNVAQKNVVSGGRPL